MTTFRAEPPRCGAWARAPHSRHRYNSPEAKLSDRADRDWQCRGTELGDSSQHGHGTDHQHRLQGRLRRSTASPAFACSITLKAIFPNPHRKLWPGMFVNVRVVTQVRDNGLTVPLDAVQQGPQGQYVFVVGPDHKVAMQPVSVRETLNGEALIDKGLSAGETVVVRGHQIGVSRHGRPPSRPSTASVAAGAGRGSRGKPGDDDRDWRSST